MKNLFLMTLAILVFTLPKSLFAYTESVVYSEEEIKPWIKRIHELPTYKYPYEHLPETLKKDGKDSITLFSYGSLMNYASAKKTLSSDALKSRKPAVAFGVRRVFNRDVPIKRGSHWGYPCKQKARAMLNLNLSENLYDIVNGVVVKVPIDEIQHILEREVGYDLVPVICVDWANGVIPVKPKFYIAYTFCAVADSIYTDSTILPRPNYYEASRNAAKDFGVIFYYMWLNTTYFADGKTSIHEWEKSLEKSDVETKECSAEELDYLRY